MLQKDLGNRALLVLLFRTAFVLGFFLSQMASSDTCFLIACWRNSRFPAEYFDDSRVCTSVCTAKTPPFS